MKKYLHFNPQLKERAKNLRRRQTPFEKKFWYEVLHNEYLNNFKWTRQKPIDNYIVDFFCFELMLAIEIDGETHTNQIYDDLRTEQLNHYNIEVIRYTNKNILDNLEGVYEDLVLKVKNRIKLLGIT